MFNWLLFVLLIKKSLCAHALTLDGATCRQFSNIGACVTPRVSLEKIVFINGVQYKPLNRTLLNTGIRFVKLTLIRSYQREFFSI